MQMEVCSRGSCLCRIPYCRWRDRRKLRNIKGEIRLRNSSIYGGRSRGRDWGFYHVALLNQSLERAFGNFLGACPSV